LSTSKDKVVLEGEVRASNRGGTFTVDVPFGAEQKTVICVPAGRLKKNSIMIVVGDRVQIEVSPYDLTKGRIIRRQ
jgi:translation initiation factor IF-1